MPTSHSELAEFSFISHCQFYLWSQASVLLFLFHVVMPGLVSWCCTGNLLSECCIKGCLHIPTYLLALGVWGWKRQAHRASSTWSCPGPLPLLWLLSEVNGQTTSCTTTQFITLSCSSAVLIQTPDDQNWAKYKAAFDWAKMRLGLRASVGTVVGVLSLQW